MKFSNISVRRWISGEPIPYELLLLADPSKSVIDAYLKDADVYVAQTNTEIIGVYVLCPVDYATIAIKNIAVALKYQGQGIGKILLAHACFKSKEKGFKKITIGTANSSIAQLYLYQREGFEMEEIQKDFFLNNYAEPIYENGILAKHMIKLSKAL